MLQRKSSNEKIVSLTGQRAAKIMLMAIWGLALFCLTDSKKVLSYE